MEQHPVFALGFGPHGTFGWIVIMLALLLIFGRRLPDVMRGLGSGVREFKKGMDDGPTKTDQPQVPLPPVEGAVSRPAVPPPASTEPPATPPPPQNPPESKPH